MCFGIHPRLESDGLQLKIRVDLVLRVLDYNLKCVSRYKGFRSYF